MCLMLYMATHGDQPLYETPALRVEEVERSRDAVRRWFSLPTVRFIGAHTGCSCGFPSVIAETRIDYYEGMLDSHPDRPADLVSVRALVTLIRAHVATGGEVELYPVCDGEEGSPPTGAILLRAEDLDPDTFFFNERFFYRVTREPAG